MEDDEELALEDFFIFYRDIFISGYELEDAFCFFFVFCEIIRRCEDLVEEAEISLATDHLSCIARIGRDHPTHHTHSD